jgi:hypothetical protein
MRESYLSYLIEVLNSQPYVGVSHEIEIAKGTYKFTDDKIQEGIKEWRLSKL